MSFADWFRVNLLFLFIAAVFSVGAFIGLWKLHEVQTRLASTTVAEGIWAISQGEGRLLDVLNVTQRYIRMPTPENADLFHERLDFMWNRLDVLSKGTIRDIASHYPAYEDTVSRFRQALKLVDTLVDPLTPETATRIHDLLQPFQTPFHHMLVSASQAVTAERADKQRALRRLVNIVALCLAIVLISGLAALLYLYRENNRAKSEMQARALTEERLRIAIAEAQAANSAKSTFLANMSHELRTPLNSILGFAQLTSRKIHGDRIDAKYLEYAAIIENSSGHLLAIINDILDLARIEAGKITLDEQCINIAKCVNTCRAIVEGNKERARIEVDIADETPGIIGDERLVRQSLLNLLSNAHVQHGRSGGCGAVLSSARRWNART